MRTFVIKAVNIALVCAILYIYQGYATKRFAQIQEYENEKETAQKAWEEAENAEEETGSFSQADGIYEGTGNGFGGEIRVQVEMQGGRILRAKVLAAENETPDYLESAKKILSEVVKKQTVEVDTISGATLSSNGILEGICNALEGYDGKE